MEELTPTWHAAHTPDAPAWSWPTRAETVTYAELDERSRRLAGALRARAIGARRPRRRPHGEQREFLEVAWAAQRSGLWYTAINSHLPAGRGAVRARRLRGGRPGGVRGDGRRRRRPRPRPRPGAGGRGRPPGVRAVRATCSPPPSRCRPARARGPRDAVLVAAPPGGPRACARTCPARRSATRRPRRCCSPGPWPRRGRASGPAPCTCARRRCTTRRRSSTRCRCSASAPPSS